MSNMAPLSAAAYDIYRLNEPHLQIGVLLQQPALHDDRSECPVNVEASI